MKTTQEKIDLKLERMPVGNRNAYLKAMRGRSMKSGIMAFCQECMSYSTAEVRKCKSYSCPLHPYKPYSD